MKIGELAKRSGLTAHTIRYYERIGLLPYADRNQSRQRDYDASILTWIEFLGRLKTTGMPIRDMLRYAALRERGVGTEAERRELLERHRAAVRAHAAELQACLALCFRRVKIAPTVLPFLHFQVKLQFLLQLFIHLATEKQRTQSQKKIFPHVTPSLIPWQWLR